MMKRIGLWAFAGFGVAVCWAFLATAFGHRFDFGDWTIFRFTFPLSWFTRMQMSYYTAIGLNAATYAALGLITEPLWRWRH